MTKHASKPGDSQSPNIHEDRPISNRNLDQFGYRPIAQQLARSIAGRGPHEGWVLGVSAPWGTGKSTLLRFLRQELEEAANAPKVVEFNPWWFTGHDDLVHKLFDEIGSATSGILKKGAKNVAETFFKTLSFDKLDLDALDADSLKGSGNALLSLFGQMAANRREVPRLKCKVAEALRKQKAQVVVMIDDIDRLTAEEMRQLFTAIKAVADLPNIVYVLAFDLQVVETALQTAQGIPGREYLEKIVQFQLSLPVPGRLTLQRFFATNLDAAIAPHKLLSFDMRRWQSILGSGIAPCLRSPRNAIRVVNSIAAMYPGVAGEVDVVDFIALSFLQVRFPDVHATIRDNLSEFMGPPSRAESEGGQRKQDAANFHEAWLNRVDADSRPAVKETVRQLFPRLDIHWRNTQWGLSHFSTWERQARVCVPRCAPRYFMYAVPDTDITHAQMTSILEGKFEGDELELHLTDLMVNQPERFSGFIENVPAFVEGADHERRARIARVLFSIGEQYLASSKTPKGLFNFGQIYPLRRAIAFLLSGVDETIFSQTISDALSTPLPKLAIDFVAFLTKLEKGDRWEDVRRVPAAALVFARTAALDRIHELATSGGILTGSPENLDGVTFVTWRDFESREVVSTWIRNQVLNRPEVFARFLSECSGTSSDSDGKTVAIADVKTVLEFISPDELDTALQSVDDTTAGKNLPVVAAFRHALIQQRDREEGQHPADSNEIE